MKGLISGAVAIAMAFATTAQPVLAMPAANLGATSAPSLATQAAWRGHGGHGIRAGRGGFHGVHRGFGGRRFGGGRHYGYRGGYPGYGYGYGYRRHYDNGGAVAAGIIGLAAGAVVGGALASQRGGGGSYCAQRFRSYNPRTGTYLGYDGLRHACP